MIKILLVGCGGFLGATSRYLIGGWAQRAAAHPWLPIGTLTVNVLGSFIIGALGSFLISKNLMKEEIQLICFVGFLGGFTTFSSFSYETFNLIKDNNMIDGMINIVLQVVLCLIATWLGYNLGKSLA